MEDRDRVAIGYADDIAIHVSDPFENTVRDIMGGALQTVLHWCTQVGLSVNPAKTILVPFTNKQKLSRELISLEGVGLAYSDQAKYLGVTLDTKLTCNAHLDALNI